MSSELRPLHIVVVSQDVPLLHEIAWILEAVGYQVQTTGDFDQDALWRRYASADFVIVDGRSIAEPTGDTFSHESDNPLYQIFLYDPTKHTDFAAWFAVGAHDALRAPVSRGELLARVRTGARYLEFERRLQHQSSRCAVPGMYSWRGLLQKLRKLAAGEDHDTSRHTLLMTSIDWYAGICHRSGAAGARNLVNTAARAIKRAAGENSVSAYFGEGRFATLLVGQSPAAAKTIAESLAKDFSSRESHHESITRPTLTSAVVPWTAGCAADRFVSDALETLHLAERSGGDRVVAHGEYNTAFAAWKEEMSTGNPFSNVVAQDIMEPFPAVLVRDAEQHELAEALRNSKIPVRPYVDRDGRLVGIADDENTAAETSIGKAGATAGKAIATPETIPHNASFPEIFEAFSSRGCATLVVTAGDHPLGYLTCDGFLSMIDPINAETFAHTGNAVDERSYLVVPSTVGEVPADQASA